MRKFESMLISAKLKASTKVSELKDKLVSKQNGDTQVVVALILIVVAVGLCIVFQNEIREVLGTVAEKVGGAVNSLTDFDVDAQ